jgi:AAA ATPase-like protein
MLLGRRSESEFLDELLVAAREGHGRALVVHGEPGIGKTALLEYAIAVAHDFRVLRTVGNVAEMGLPFAALNQLCSPGLETLNCLPEPQRDALGVALGLVAGAAPDRLLVGLALLSLLSQLTSEQPLLCVVDDTQWLDRESAQAFAFVARRLETERIALVFGARSAPSEVRGLPELLVEGLHPSAARDLLQSA